MNDPAQDAIAAALKGEWDLAIKINCTILDQEPRNTDALNRLARAYCELGDIQKAKVYSQKVMKIDPFNTIAAKSLLKWKGVKGKTKSSPQALTDPRTFLEESGKTKITLLMNLGETKTIAALDAADELKLNVSPHRVSVTTQNGSYVGKLSDDISARLRKLIKTGNKYLILVKSVDTNGVKVFIREVERASVNSEIPSFPTERIDYVSFTPPESVHKKSDHQNQED